MLKCLATQTLLDVSKSELAVVVRAATKGMGLRSILSDFSLCDHAATKSDDGVKSPVGRKCGGSWARPSALGSWLYSSGDAGGG